MKKRFLVLLVFFLAAVPCVFSIPLEEIVPAYAALLRSGGEPVIETQLRNPSPQIMPLDNELRQYVSMVIRSLNPNMMTEALFLYEKPEHAHTSPAYWDNTQKIGIYNELLAISTLTGIQYYSASRGEMRTFFEHSEVIDGPNTRRPLPDPLFATPPSEYTLYARQRDLTFGDNLYRYNYMYNRDSIFFVQENLTPLNIAIVQAIRRNNLRSVIAVFDCGDSILIYAISMARTLSVPGMGERIGSSLANRAEAILKWFAVRAESVFLH